ncbi:toxic anion resistance protein [Metabacillus indicus]|uniref:toxic anion resistance protein n=1 Tax=Metabacillus indicus TaxID=246786 RepID=UPI00317F5CA5
MNHDLFKEDENLLQAEEKEKVLHLVNQLSPKNHSMLVSFGLPAQSKLLAFSNTMLDQVQRKDIGQIGATLDEFIKSLSEVNPEDLMQDETSFFGRLFGRKKRSVQEVLSRFHKAGVQIDRISVRLERSKNVLLSDIVMLDRLYETNREYFHSLNTYIEAAELKLHELHNETIPALKKTNEGSSDPMKRQEEEDLLQFADQLDQRLYDLKVSRELTIQSAPQIRMIQKTNQKLAEKIQASLMTAIPLWKNQVTIALTLLRQKHAADAGKTLTSSANDLYQKQSSTLGRNQFDLQTLKEIQENLQMAIKETLSIHKDGKHTREETEAALLDIEQKKLQA